LLQDSDNLVVLVLLDLRRPWRSCQFQREVTRNQADRPVAARWGEFNLPTFP
jgi:hypothetical protein